MRIRGPVADLLSPASEAVPAMLERQWYTMRRLLMLVIVLGPGVLMGGAIVGQHGLVPALLFTVVWDLMFFGLLVTSRHPLVLRRPEPFIFVVGVVLATLVSFTPWLDESRLGQVQMTPVIPLLVASLSFARPSVICLLGAYVLPCALISEWAWTGQIDATAADRTMVGVALTIVGAVSCKLFRHLWFQWEESRRHLAASERIAHLGWMTAGIAHELKTPIAATDGALLSLGSLCEELAASIGHDDVNDDDLREIASEIDQSVKLGARAVTRAAKFVNAMRGQTRGLSDDLREPFCVAERMDAVQTMLAHRLKTTGVKLSCDIEPDLRLFGNPGTFDQVLTNLVSNAINAIDESKQGGVVTVRARRVDHSLRLEVQDDGPGVPAALRARIFDYMFTSRSQRGGTGLGLALCRDIIAGEFRGSVELVSDPSGGALFVCALHDANDSPSQPLATFVPSPALCLGAPPTCTTER